MAKQWIDCGRDDLKVIPTMIELGYTVQFNRKDMQNGRTTPENVPHDDVSFQKGNYQMWKFMKKIGDETYYIWNTGRWINEHIKNHKWFMTIEEAIKHEKEE